MARPRAAPLAPFVSGIPEIDAILRTFEQKEVQKAVRMAARKTIVKHVKPSYRAHVEAAEFVETRATIQAAKVRQINAIRKRGIYGAELFIDREKVVQTRRERGGRIGYDKKRGEDFFHPVAIEFGTETVEPKMPLRTALKGNTAKALAIFYAELKIALVKVEARARAKALKPRKR